jgi:hypothetical protein
VITNAGFETQEPSTVQPGIADDWTSTTVAALEATAEFAGDTGLTLAGYEMFENGWGTADPQTLVADMIATLVESRPNEPFEIEWTPDQGFLFLTALEVAVFDSTAFENFEDAWGVIDSDLVLSPAEVEVAVFEPGTFEETFEASWGSIATPAFSSASFDTGGLSENSATPSSSEQFLFKAKQRFTPDTSTNKLNAVSLLAAAVGNAFTLTAESGDLPAPLAEGKTYIVGTVVGNAITLVAFGGGTTIDITSEGSGANYLNADPGRFWLDEL